VCGRYNVTPNAQAFIDAFEISAGLDALPAQPLYNIAPGDDKHPTFVPIVREHDATRELAMVHWPFIPRWAKGLHVKYSTANAKGETVAEKPAYRDAWQKRRCLIPASGYYEWQVVPGQRYKQPYHIQLRDGALFAFGGLWERSTSDTGTSVESCTIVTTEPCKAISHIHNRMPVIVPAEGYADWLAGSTDHAARWVAPYSHDDIIAYPISKFVNNPRNNDARCLEPLTEGP